MKKKIIIIVSLMNMQIWNIKKISHQQHFCSKKRELHIFLQKGCSLCSWNTHFETSPCSHSDLSHNIWTAIRKQMIKHREQKTKRILFLYLLLGEINDILKIRIFPIKFYEFGGQVFFYYTSHFLGENKANSSNCQFCYEKQQQTSRVLKKQ